MIQTYIEHLYAGIIVSDSSSTKVNDRSLPKSVSKYCFGFRFYERTEMETTDGEKLIGEPKNYSHWYYLKGEVLNKNGVEEKYPEKKILISNMKSNNIKKVVFTKFGQAIPLEKNDVVLEKELEINK